MKSVKQSGKSAWPWTLKKSLPLPVTHYTKTLQNFFTKPPFTEVPAWDTPVSSYRTHFCALEMFVRFRKTARWFFSGLADATHRDDSRDIQIRHLVKHSCLLFSQCFLSALQAKKALGLSPVLLFPAAVSCRLHRVLLEGHLWQSRIRSLSYELLVQTGPLCFLLAEGKPERTNFSLWLRPLQPMENHCFEHSDPKGR